MAAAMKTTIKMCLRALCIAALFLAPLAHAETITYQHDNSGNITQRGTTTFAYDALNRLIGEAGPAKTQTIAYDENGNRSYTYELTSNRMLTRRGLAVTLDLAGNITADGTGRTLAFNQAGQLYQVFQGGILIATYIYDYRGLRISKDTTASAPQGAQTVVYHYDLDGKLIAETTGSGLPLRTYVWQDDTPLAQIEYQPSRKIYYFNVDHLKTPRSLMDDTGKIVWRWESDAFGSTLPNEDADGDGVKITSNLRFAGQYYDKETGLHYNGHRYYDPSMGQYIQADPIGLAAGTNLYAYVKGNPLKYVDPTGLAGVLPGPIPLPLPGPSIPGQSKPKDDGSGGLFPGTMPTPVDPYSPDVNTDRPVPIPPPPEVPGEPGKGCKALFEACMKGAKACGLPRLGAGVCLSLYLICESVK
jgi:RHS repeat-associated protein